MRNSWPVIQATLLGLSGACFAQIGRETGDAWLSLAGNVLAGTMVGCLIGLLWCGRTETGEHGPECRRSRVGNIIDVCSCQREAWLNYSRSKSSDEASNG